MPFFLTVDDLRAAAFSALPWAIGIAALVFIVILGVRGDMQAARIRKLEEERKK